MNIYSFTLNPITIMKKFFACLSNRQTKELNQLSSESNSTIALNCKSTNNNFKFKTKEFYFKTIKKNVTRKYLNDWNELREFIGYNDVETDNNEIIICYIQKLEHLNKHHFNMVRIMQGMYFHHQN